MADMVLGRRGAAGPLVLVASTAAWLLVAALFLPQFVAMGRGGDAAPLRTALERLVVVFAPWLLMTPAVIAATRRRPLTPRSLPVHLPVALLLSGAHVIAAAVIARAFGHAAALDERLIAGLAAGLCATDVVLYVAIAALTTSAVHARAAAHSERLLAQAQLAALKATLHPHFLFNTLNAIGELVHCDARRAHEALMHLAALLRAQLDASDKWTTVDEELAFIRRYLEIHRLLLGDRLTVRWALQPEALAAHVPSQVLQPLVENALEHGIAPRVAGGMLCIAASIERSTLRITVADDGPGPPHRPGNGIGLATTRERVRIATRGQGSVTLERDPNGGTIARVALPLGIPRS